MKFDWHKVWERKGSCSSNDLYSINGYENTNFDPNTVVEDINNSFKIDKNFSILEVGAGAGLLAQFFDCNYVGIDYSESMIKKLKNLGKEGYVAQANNLPFCEDSFDGVFCYSVFHYFPNLKYSKKVIQEMCRVSKKFVFIGDLPVSSHNSDHLLFKKEMFKKWKITKSNYNKNRFNVFREIP